MAHRAMRKLYQGDEADRMLLVKAGRVRLYKVLEDGSETLLDIRKSGDFLGEQLFSEEETRFPLAAACVEKTLACRLGAECPMSALPWIFDVPEMTREGFASEEDQAELWAAWKRLGRETTARLRERMFMEENGSPSASKYPGGPAGPGAAARSNLSRFRRCQEVPGEPDATREPRNPCPVWSPAWDPGSTAGSELPGPRFLRTSRTLASSP